MTSKLVLCFSSTALMINGWIIFFSGFRLKLSIMNVIKNSCAIQISKRAGQDNLVNVSFVGVLGNKLKAEHGKLDFFL